MISCQILFYQKILFCQNCSWECSLERELNIDESFFLLPFLYERVMLNFEQNQLEEARLFPHSQVNRKKTCSKTIPLCFETTPLCSQMALVCSKMKTKSWCWSWRQTAWYPWFLYFFCTSPYWTIMETILLGPTNYICRRTLVISSLNKALSWPSYSL